jgi:aerobic C4-dicarboxylate transport protein
VVPFILSVILVSVLFGFALSVAGPKVKPVVDLLDGLTHTVFGVVNILMRLAPIGAFGAMAFTIGRYGIGSLVSLGQLMLAVYGTCALFIFVVLGAIARLAGFSLWKLLRYIREEILIVAGTASSETVLPRIMEKMERLGCRRSVVGEKHSRQPDRCWHSQDSVRGASTLASLIGLPLYFWRSNES